MSLPTDPFAAPSTGPQAVVLRRAGEDEIAGWDPDAQQVRQVGGRRPALVAAGAAGVLAVGASVVGVALTSGGPAPVAPSSLAPAAGAAATLTPPAVGNPIVPPEVTPPAVTTRERPVAETTRSSAPRRTRTAPPEVREAREVAVVVQKRILRQIERARERADAHRHGGRHR
ncbi:hypothetical protein WCD74_13580 [Actinomycetospora sp. OC33-EN08]|uniref:Uncharacterized protein n=1 Tax=Actinomycetospora aurantiaca TaxID=3129233 RepID=A0ABU8MNS6_9PSEU